MARKVVVIVLLIAACMLACSWYTHRAGSLHTADGSVYPTDSADTPIKPAPSRSDAPGTINTEPIAQDGAGNIPAPSNPSVPSYVASTASPYTAAKLPASDTDAPNAPNGLAFGGTGKYQWYRQGNLTWRVDTSSGSSCIAFATMEEWRKRIVSSHGCGNT